MDATLTAAVFLFGALVGAALTWSLAVANERWRRIRRELRAARKGVKTLRTMMIREGKTLAGLALVVTLIGAAVIVLVVTR